ncbi:hypothetical protein TTHERM_000024089 (macronuclear) [Tetrahymena thermophila SB210]|uniref:Kinase domain protein n=1 Tax=Tetrahymena thermophila (strain SB210) TaxID=312017 RepID=W7XF16_TETTS|nr:hypothetical protein TTHERM_000024089 [Tetrahymena thermophila SB210]EWS76392.1 hypothetical protein TTHERM_000024089 [Tetrahymena thermophila SB210]|eukprot:XP_012651176.1 hypothetical protein TTHERM_000024089 [Tetrahymena thermophila SB210]
MIIIDSKKNQLVDLFLLKQNFTLKRKQIYNQQIFIIYNKLQQALYSQIYYQIQQKLINQKEQIYQILQKFGSLIDIQNNLFAVNQLNLNQQNNQIEKINLIKIIIFIQRNQDLKDFDAGDIGVIASNFKNIQNLCLDLSNNQITNDGFSYLLSDIQKCKHLCNLQINLSNNQIDLNSLIEEQICQLKIKSYEIQLNGNKHQGKVKQSFSFNQKS